MIDSYDYQCFQELVRALRVAAYQHHELHQISEDMLASVQRDLENFLSQHCYSCIGANEYEFDRATFECFGDAHSTTGYQYGRPHLFVNFPNRAQKVLAVPVYDLTEQYY